MNLTPAESKELKKKLPPAHMKKIRAKLQEQNSPTFSDRYIRLTISGDRMSPQIMKAIISVISDYKKEVKDFKKKLKNI